MFYYIQSKHMCARMHECVVCVCVCLVVANIVGYRLIKKRYAYPAHFEDFFVYYLGQKVNIRVFINGFGYSHDLFYLGAAIAWVPTSTHVAT